MIQKYKQTHDISYTLGITLTIELLKIRPNIVLMVYLHSSIHKNESYDLIHHLCHQYRIDVIENDKVFQKLSDKENCYAIGVFKKYETSIHLSQNHLVLENPSDAGNLGTIIRSMIGFGMFNLVIIKPSTDLFHPKLIRASMGSFFHINFKLYDTFEDYKAECNNRFFYPFILNAKHTLGKIVIKEPFSLIFGNESRGLSAKFTHIGTPLKIVHKELIDSLNLPIAVSIGLYEITKEKI